MKKLLMLVSAVCITTTLLSGCSGTSKTTEGEKQQGAGNSKDSYLNLDSKLPIAKSPITMSMAVVRPSNGAAADKMWYFKWVEKNANIKFNVTQIEASAWSDRSRIMFASNEVPDIFLHTNMSNDDVMRYGQVEKVFMPMNDLIEKYAPSIKKVFAEMPNIKAGATCPDGKIYGLPSTNITEQYSIQRPWINKVWLDSLGLKEPENLDDLYTVLKTFKEKDPNKNGKADEIPFGGSWNEGMTERTVVLTALGFNQSNALAQGMSPCIKANKVVFAEADPLYSEYLKYMNKLFTEGLLDKDIFTQTDVQAKAKSAQNIVGLAIDSAPYFVSPNKPEEYKAFKPIISKWNDKRIWPDSLQNVTVGGFSISGKCKYPEAAIRLADLYYAEDMSYLFWIGPKKDSADALGFGGWFVDDKGVRQWDWTADIKTPWDMTNQLNPINGPKLGINFDNVQPEKVFNVKFAVAERDLAWKALLDKDVMPYSSPVFPNLFFTQEQLERRNILKTTITDYCRTMEAKFITGAEPLANIDKYFAELKKLGIDEFTKIYQDGYDAFQKNLKK